MYTGQELLHGKTIMTHASLSGTGKKRPTPYFKKSNAVNREYPFSQTV
jgi:hypothetical protein